MLTAIDFRPDVRTLKRFGWIALAAFTALGIQASGGHAIFSGLPSAFRMPIALALAALAGLCGLLSLLYPKGNWALYVGLSVLGYPFGWVISWVLLAFLFVFVLGPVALVLRATRADPLSRRYDPSLPSYWTKRPESSPAARYFRRF